jgi:FlaA1/EpsC-like NDP-sugar epimerase
VGVAFFMLAYYFRFKGSFSGISRLLLLEELILSAGITWIWHILFDFFKRAMLRLSPPSFPTLIVGVTRESKALIESLRRNMSPFTPVAILDAHGAKEKEIHGVPVRGKLDLLEETIRREKITHMIQASGLEQTLNLLSACRHHRITYILLPSVLGIVDRDKRIEDLEGYPVTVVRPRRSEILSFFR